MCSILERITRALLLTLALASCGGESAPPDAIAHPADFPEPFVPADNAFSEAKAALGRHLFYDKRLSANGTMSCASCHEQARAFSDGKPTPTGSTGQRVPRNSMALANVAWLSTYTWANPVLDTLEKQALVPLLGEAPIELGVGTALAEVLGRFAADARYQSLFATAFPGQRTPVTLDNVVRALASFQRTLVSGASAYDRYVREKDPGALSPAAKRGMALFFSERCECYHCHAGTFFTTSFRAKGSAAPDRDFNNTGLYNLDGAGAYPPDNTGLHDLTRKAEDMGKFRVPSLRNVEVSAPYMHDGSIATLEEVIDHYARGGRALADGPFAGDGAKNPWKNPLVRGFELTAAEKQDLVEFLRSLTDPTFLADPRLADPFAGP